MKFTLWSLVVMLGEYGYCGRILLHDRAPVGVVCSDAEDPQGLFAPYYDHVIDTVFYARDTNDVHVTLYN